MKLNFLEKAHAIQCSPSGLIAAAEDIYTGDPATDVISLKNADSIVFILQQTANAGGNASVWVYACDDTTPTNSTAISFYYKLVNAGDVQGATTETQAFLTSTAANQMYVIEVPAAKVVEQGYEYVQLHTVEVTATAVDGGIIAFLMGMRYASDAEGTQLT